MDFKNKIVSHKTFGVGTVIDLDGSYITVSFPVGEKKFTFPDAFTSFIKNDDQELNDYLLRLFELKKEREQLLRVEKEKQLLEEQEHEKLKSSPQKSKYKVYRRQNIAFKCNFCNGGHSDEQIGFCSVCSDDLIKYNIDVAKHIWCSSADSDCLRYLNGEISREELDDYMNTEYGVCYESQMLNNWTAFAGIVHSGEREGMPMKLNQVQVNSLCVLTTREPNTPENERFIFAAFLVDETYEGDMRDAGYVTTKSEYKIKLSPKEAKKMLYWNYHANSNQQEVTAWGSGLHRYYDDIEAAQILKDIATIKKGTEAEDLANKFFKHFCLINKVDIDNIPKSNGALKLISGCKNYKC